MLSFYTVIDDCIPCSLAQIYKQIHESKFILCKLHDSFSSVHRSVATCKLHKHWQTAVKQLAKFHVQAGELLLVFVIFCSVVENSKKHHPFLQRVIARQAAKFRSHFQANFHQISWEQMKFTHFDCITLHNTVVMCVSI